MTDLPWSDAPSVTTDTLVDMPFRDFLSALEPWLLEPVPEGAEGDPEVLRQIDRLLGRFANLYSYLVFLHAFASYEAKRLSLAGAQQEYSLMIEKRDALYEFSRAVKQKKEACSRMLTVWQEETGSDNFDRVDYEGREERARRRRSHKTPDGKTFNGWDAVG